MKYKLEDFDEFLLSNNISVIKFGLKMIYYSFPIENYNLEELCELKYKLVKNDLYKYKTNNEPNLIKKINRNLLKYSHSQVSKCFYNISKKYEGDVKII